MAETRIDVQIGPERNRCSGSPEYAYNAFDSIVKRFGDKYPCAMNCLIKDKEQMLAFYDFPAIHWQHIRTSNPIESTFATVRLRTAKTRNAVSRATILSMVFKLAQSAEKRWRKLRGFKLLADVIDGVKFVNGSVTILFRLLHQSFLNLLRAESSLTILLMPNNSEFTRSLIKLVI